MCIFVCVRVAFCVNKHLLKFTGVDYPCVHSSTDSVSSNYLDTRHEYSTISIITSYLYCGETVCQLISFCDLFVSICMSLHKAYR